MLPRVNVAGREYAETPQVCQVNRVVPVVGVLEPLVLFDRRGVDQLDRVARFHHTIDEPVPVEGRLNGHRDDAISERLQLLENQRELVVETPLENNLVLGVDDGDVTVVRMKIDTAVK